MKKRQLYDKKTGRNFVPIGHTKAVLTPTGETAEARNTRQMQAVKGTGEDASASQFPFMSLGNATSISEVNQLLDTAFRTTDTKYQGWLRIRRTGQTAWVNQVLMNSLLGHWVQVLYGCYAPSQNGNAVVVDGKYHILWRKREGSASLPWQDLTSQMTLKTVNGQSILGSGNIQIAEAQQITIDQELDDDSENAVANKAVTEAVGSLQTQMDDKAPRKSGITLIDVWSETIDETHEEKPEGALWWDGSSLYKKVNGEWVDVTEEEEYEDVFFLNQTDDTLHFYSGGGDMTKLFYWDFTELEKRTAVRYYRVEGVFKSNNLPGSSWHIVDSKYSGTGGIVWIDTYGTPRPLLGVWENQAFNLYTDWTVNDTRQMPSDYHFTENDFYVYRNTEASGPGIIFAYYTGSYWQTSEDVSDYKYIPGMYDVAYNEDDTDEHGDFPAGDATHEYAMYGTTIYKWSTTSNEWVQISGTDEWYPVLVKFKNKLLKVWADEDPEVIFDFSLDTELDTTSENAVQNKVVAQELAAHDDRLDTIEEILPTIRGAKVFPIDGVMPAGYTYIVEQTGYAGDDGNLLLDVTNGRVVLAVEVDDGEEVETLYYVDWNENGGRLPDDSYDLTDPTNILFTWVEDEALHFGVLSSGSVVEVGTGSAPAVVVDSALSRTSANPVQNAVVTGAINTLTTSLNSQNERVTRMENTATKVVWTIQVWGEDETVYENWAVDDLWWDTAEAELKRCVEAYVPNEPRFVTIEPSFGTLYYISDADKWCVWNGVGFDELLRDTLVISSSTL